MNAQEIVAQVIAGLTAEDGTFNHAEFKEVMKQLGVERSNRMEDREIWEKTQKKTLKQQTADRGLAYLQTLEVGTPIQWMSNGEVQNGTVGEQKKGSKTAHLILNEIPANSKAKNPKADRYVQYDKIIVPETFVMAATEEAVA